MSRCEVLRLRPVPHETVSLGLQTVFKIPGEQARFLAQLSGGRPGFALQLHTSPEKLEERKQWISDHLKLLHDSRVERFVYAERLSKDKENLQKALQTWLSLWRDVLLRAAGTSNPIANPDQANAIEELAKQFSLETTHKVVSALQQTLDRLDRNVNARLATEVLMLDLPKITLPPAKK